MALLGAALVCVTVMTLVVGVWTVHDWRRRIGERLGTAVGAEAAADAESVLKASRSALGKPAAWLRRTSLHGRFTVVTEQAGYPDAGAEWLAVIGAAGLVGGVATWLRTGGVSTAAAAVLVFGALPLGYLFYKRHQRLLKFEQQFPDTLSMMTRALRAGSALAGAIQLVAEEMPAPVGIEFTRVFEEIRLGLDPAEALVRLKQRVPTDDLRFFCTAVTIQRGAGGNLAEILERLSEVIRERFKLLSYARVLSSQHRWTAICVGASPVVFAAILHLASPDYFEPLLTSPYGATLIEMGVVLEIIGFFTIWRLAKIKV